MDLKSLWVAALMASVASVSIAAGVPEASEGASVGAGSATVVLDETTLWRHFHVAGPSHLRDADGKLFRAYVNWKGKMREASQNEYLKLPVRAEKVPQGFESPLPGGDWASPAFDDSAWPRLWWPQPELPSEWFANEANDTRARHPYHTVLVLARAKFQVEDPAQVKSCMLSLDYWGGVVVYVNGKEAARGHMPADVRDFSAPAEDYPDAAFTTADGRPLKIVEQDVLSGAALGKAAERLALRDRKLRDVSIAPALLRKGVNVIAIEAHAAPVPLKASGGSGWPSIGLLSARLTISPAGAAVAHSTRPRGFQVWNTAVYDTVTAFEYGAASEPLRPVVIRAARNSVFSGRLMVGSDRPIKGLKVNVEDLVRSGGNAKIASSAVRVRYAVPATPGKSWVVPGRFDGLMDVIPAEIPVIQCPPLRDTLYYLSVERKTLVAGAVAPLWFTVRVPRDAAPGVYEGAVSITADGVAPTSAVLRVEVCGWTMPDLLDFRIQNFLYHAEEVQAQHYGVPNYSDKHLELVGKSLALLAEVNSRQVQANLSIDFFAQIGRSNPESLVRWIKRPDGTFTHDFSVFDRWLDMLAKSIGKPRTLRLNCWGESLTRFPGYDAGSRVSLLDPATGKITPMPQPPLGTEESYAFWKPVFDEVLNRVKARGWLDETTIGYNQKAGVPAPSIVEVAHRLWPEGEWSYSSHSGAEEMRFFGPFEGARPGERPDGAIDHRYGKAAHAATGRVVVNDPNVIVMPVRHADGIQSDPTGKLPPLWMLDQLRRRTFCTSVRNLLDDNSPPREMRRLVELNSFSRGYDGVSMVGADLFPLKRPLGGYYAPAWGRSMNTFQWSTLALLYPGPDGPVATERFEMFREGLQLCEAIIFIRRAMAQGKLSADLQTRAERYLRVKGERDTAFERGWFAARYMQAEEDAKLLDLADEAAREIQK